MALSVASPKHLEKIGLLKDYKDSEEDNINALFKMALKRVAFLPFGYLIDKWRWDVFSGKVPESQWNEHWWKLRQDYQKVSPPVTRSENDFDPGAKYHIPADSQYIAYFFAHILEFQLHRGLCLEAGQYDPKDPTKPLHKCDIDGSKQVGAKISKGLSLGLSRHWTEALEAMTGETQISGEALTDYFAPLYKFLKKENDNDQVAAKFLARYTKEASVSMNNLVKAEWAVATDTLNDTLKEEYDAAVLENAKFSRGWYEKEFKNWHPDNFTDESVKRQIRLLTSLGLNALPDDKLSTVSLTDYKPITNPYSRSISAHKDAIFDGNRLQFSKDLSI
jgi:peptidyl-dipeptidase A